eukprot:gene12442-biopygen10995
MEKAVPRDSCWKARLLPALTRIICAPGARVAARFLEGTTGKCTANCRRLRGFTGPLSGDGAWGPACTEDLSPIFPKNDALGPHNGGNRLRSERLAVDAAEPRPLFRLDFGVEGGGVLLRIRVYRGGGQIGKLTKRRSDRSRLALNTGTGPKPRT